MYPLLPTMRGVTPAIIRQAVDELAELYREDEVTLSQQIVWLELLLERTETIPQLDKERIRERLKMYDRLWEDNPKVKNIRAESKAEGLAEGQVEGEVRALQRALVSIVSVRFPELTELARQHVVLIQQPDALDLLVRQLTTAPDERVARWILSPSAA